MHHTPKIISLLLAIVFLTPPTSWASEKPALVVFISIDQLRGDLPLRMKDRFGQHGFRYFMDHGVYYTNAHFRHATTFTASGHATLVTGGNPAQHGLIGNTWYNREIKERFYALADLNHTVLNGNRGPGVGTSPANMKSTTIGDELISATNGKARVFSVSIKDRSAIAMSGRGGKAFWYDTKTGHFTSSTYYYATQDQLPPWARQWNENNTTDRLLESTPHWELLQNPTTYLKIDSDQREYEMAPAEMGTVFPHPLPPAKSKELYSAIRYTPFGDTITVDFAKHLITHEQLGHHDRPDILNLSLSCTDLIGHAFGPESLEAEDNLLRLDALLAQFIEFIDSEIGLDKTLIVLAADHGVDSIPEDRKQHHFHAGTLAAKDIQSTINTAIQQKYTINQELVEAIVSPYIYLDTNKIALLNLDLQDVEETVAAVLKNIDGIANAVCRSHLLKGTIPNTPLMKRVINSFDPDRFGNIIMIQEPFHLISDFHRKKAATHGSPYTYDTYVPIMFAGMNITQQEVQRLVGPEDIAPTLAVLLATLPPSGSTGTALAEILTATPPVLQLPRD
jgi:predicted AlkP superfamily pyrophosphatase or phosphodiesterase